MSSGNLSGSKKSPLQINGDFYLNTGIGGRKAAVHLSMIDLNDIALLNRLYEKNTFTLRMAVYGMKPDPRTLLPMKYCAQRFSVYFTPGGRLAKILSAYPKKFEALFFYNSEGQLVRKMVHSMEQELMFEDVYTYTSNGELFYTRSYTFGTEEPHVRHHFKLTPDDAVHEIFIDQDAQQPSTMLTHEIERDDLGREITHRVYENDALLYGYTQELTDDNQPLLRLYIDKSGQPSAHTYYEYNGLGELIKKTTTIGEDIKTHVYQYTYHQRGHWQEVAHLCNGELIWITEREVLHFHSHENKW